MDWEDFLEIEPQAPPVIVKQYVPPLRPLFGPDEDVDAEMLGSDTTVVASDDTPFNPDLDSHFSISAGAKANTAQDASIVEAEAVLAQVRKALEGELRTQGLLQKHIKRLSGTVEALKKEYSDQVFKRDGATRDEGRSAPKIEAAEEFVGLQRRKAVRDEILAALDALDELTADEPDSKRETVAAARQGWLWRAAGFASQKASLWLATDGVRSKFGSSVELSFKLFRTLVFLNLALSLLWLPFVVGNAIKLSQTSRALIRSVIPWFLLIGPTSSGDVTAYTASLFAFIAYSLLASFAGILRAQALKFRVGLEALETADFSVSSAVFSGLKFSKRAEDVKEQRRVVAMELREALSEESSVALKRKLMGMPLQEFLKKEAKAWGSFALNWGLIFGGWAAFVAIKFMSWDVSSSLALSTAKNLVPTIVSKALPVITALSTSLVKWDIQSDKTKTVISRLYASKIILAVLQGVIELFFVLGHPSGIPRLELRDCDMPTCFDQVGFTLFSVVAVDVSVTTISSTAATIAKHVLAKRYARFQSLAPRFDVPECVIELLYWQLLLWMLAPFFPVGFIVGSALLVLSFLTRRYVAIRFVAPPEQLFRAKDTDALIQRLLTISLALFFAYAFVVVRYFEAQYLDPCCGNSKPAETCFSSSAACSVVSYSLFTKDSTYDLYLPSTDSMPAQVLWNPLACAAFACLFLLLLSNESRQIRVQREFVQNVSLNAMMKIDALKRTCARQGKLIRSYATRATSA